MGRSATGGKKQITVVGVMQHKQGQGSERMSVVDFTNLNEVQQVARMQ